MSGSAGLPRSRSRPGGLTGTDCTAEGTGRLTALCGALASHGIREAINYQPASRYSRFQATETAMYLALALALALAGYCFRRLARLS
jgi:hypothetical protein